MNGTWCKCRKIVKQTIKKLDIILTLQIVETISSITFEVSMMFFDDLLKNVSLACVVICSAMRVNASNLDVNTISHIYAHGLLLEHNIRDPWGRI